MKDLKVGHARRRNHNNRCRQLRPMATALSRVRSSRTLTSRRLWAAWDRASHRPLPPSWRIPNRTVVAHIGDGGFLMTGQEMATAKQYGANIISIVYNNEGYNSIRMHQEAQYPGRQHGMALENPDFAKWASLTARSD